MKLGAVSGTHDNLDYVEATVPHFEFEGVDVVVHCGGIVVPFSATPLGADFDFHAVRGNNNGKRALRKAVESFGTYHGDFAHLTPNNQEIAVYYDMEVGLVDALVDSGMYDFVLHGHSHEWVVEHRRATMHINSGGLPIPGVDDAFHVAVMDLNTGNVASRSLRKQDQMGGKPHPNHTAPS